MYELLRGKLIPVRLLAVFAIIVGAAFSRADQLITIPTGSKIPYGDVRLSTYTGLSSGYALGSADFGIGTSFEAALRGFRPDDGAAVGTFDFAYNYISPLSGLTPGISIGVQDGLNQTPDGRRFYLAITSRDIYSTESGDQKGDVTIGLFVGAHSSGFVGLDLPLSSYMRLIAEHNGYRISAGIELRPVRSLGVRFIAVDGHPVVGLTTVTRF